ncbi:VanZ family protein [Algoriphagus sp. SE2]|uniref:VanZ family protein n=1 Tax=Algoriphagus sp. SE2 TaxID=3141536 RepID=UPI0031CD3B07
MRRNRWFYISIAIIMILVWTPSEMESSGLYFDKVAHFLMFFGLSVNACFKFKNPVKLVEAMIWIILFALLTEFIQKFVPGRDMDIYDGIADTVGVIAGYYFYKVNSSKLDKLLIKIGA